MDIKYNLSIIWIKIVKKYILIKYLFVFYHISHLIIYIHRVHQFKPKAHSEAPYALSVKVCATTVYEGGLCLVHIDITLLSLLYAMSYFKYCTSHIISIPSHLQLLYFPLTVNSTSLLTSFLCPN